MKDFIIKVQKYDYSDCYEIRCYERGLWQHDSYIDDIDEAIERMNFLIEEYEYKADEVELVKRTYYKNITDNKPF